MNPPANFELHVRRPLADGSFPVTARVPDADQLAEDLLALPLDDALTTAFLDAWQAGSIEAEAARRFGTRLFDALFQGAIRDLYLAVRARHGHAFRYRLILDSPDVARLPWELLYDPERNTFLALETSLVRGFVLAEPAQPLKVQPPLRILVCAAFPSDLPSIAGQDEIDAILHELADLVRRDDAEVVPLAHAGARSLQNALREAAARGQPFHILHIISHAVLNPTLGAAALYLEDEQGRAQAMDPSALAGLLRPFDLKLVYLNACETAALSAFDVTHGFAPALMSIGTPAVIGMQIEVWDRIARQVAQDFYAALADNQPVDQALLSARQLAYGNASSRASIAIPVCYLRTTSGQIVDLIRPGAPRLTRATWREWLKIQATPKRMGQGFVGLVGFASAVLGIYLGIAQLRPDPVPIPVPTALPMAGRFNIAVAAFSQLDTQGSTVESNAGAELAHNVEVQLRLAVQGLQNPAFKVELVGPDRVGIVTGATDTEREINAAFSAAALNADLLIYGHMVLAPDSTTLVPYLYVSPERLTNAAELSGSSPFGANLRIVENIDSNLVALKQLQDDLARRTDVLARFVAGLSYFRLNNLTEAARWFEDARRASGADSKILRVVLLFLGSTAARAGDLQEADMYYGEALKKDPTYARARLGQALVEFQQARGNCSLATVDAAGLDRAIAGYQEARDIPNSHSEEIATKAAFYLGQAYLCQAQAGNAASWDKAQVQLERVVEGYEADKDYRFKYLAAEALFHVGMLYVQNVDAPVGRDAQLVQGADAFRQAIELSGLSDRQATFNYWLAWTHGQMDQCDQAQQDMQAGDAAHLLFKANNPTFDTQNIMDFQRKTVAELTKLCPTT